MVCRSDLSRASGWVGGKFQPNLSWPAPQAPTRAKARLIWPGAGPHPRQQWLTWADSEAIGDRRDDRTAWPAGMGRLDPVDSPSPFGALHRMPNLFGRQPELRGGDRRYGATASGSHARSPLDHEITARRLPPGQWTRVDPGTLTPRLQPAGPATEAHRPWGSGPVA